MTVSGSGHEAPESREIVRAMYTYTQFYWLDVRPELVCQVGLIGRISANHAPRERAARRDRVDELLTEVCLSSHKALQSFGLGGRKQSGGQGIFSTPSFINS